MTHFDFKTLLPALLQVEDRVSMAHGLESRVPLLDHPLIELAASIPADIKFKDGRLKHIFKQTFGKVLPRPILDRKDKMGFPTPLTEFVRGPARGFVRDVFSTASARTRRFVNAHQVLERLDAEPKFGRKIWGLLSLELWHQAFHDQRGMFTRLADQPIRVGVQSGSRFHEGTYHGRGGFHRVSSCRSAAGSRRRSAGHRQFRDRSPGQSVERPGFRLVEGTIADPTLVAQAFGSLKPDVVIHAAASYKDPNNWAGGRANQRAGHRHRRPGGA